MSGVLHVLDMTVNLLSVSAMTKKGIKAVAEGDRIELSRGSRVVATAILTGNTYLLKGVAPEAVLLAETS